MRTVVLVHGAWHGAWCWAPVLAGLDERGIPAVAVDLPGPDLYGDADHVSAVLDGVDGTALLVGHSYGGAVITHAGTHPAVERLVYVAAFAPDDDEPLTEIDLPGGEASEALAAIRLLDDGTSVLDPTLVGPVFYGDCARVDVDRAVSLVRPHPMATFQQAPRTVAWKAKPTIYAVCGADRVVPPGLQRSMAARIPGAAIVEWPDSSHSPFFSRPGDVVDLLTAAAIP